MNLWLDDVRDPADYNRVGWVWAKTYDEAVASLSTGEVEELSLDHDLTPAQTNPADGTVKHDGEKCGCDVVKWMIQNRQCWPKGRIHIHSQNPGGIQIMSNLLMTV
jgi:hypothetical protein